MGKLKLKLRYTDRGEVESYDVETGKAVGHVSTMGNILERTKEDEEREKKEIEQLEKKYGLR